ncbi:MAG: AraC family transcriptional regulator, partial [Paenibacillus sp.]|nr:AraC family transcriptional regulator [Paenibacillus sp.]
QQRNDEYDEEIVVLDIRKTLRLVQSFLRSRLPLEAKESGKPKAGSDFILKLMRYMEASYAEPIDLSDLAGRVHLNASYIVRAFKHETGVTPMQYLNKLRLDAAICFLRHTDMRVQQIAESTGFNSIHYFSRLFKSKYGASPQQWRLTHQERPVSAR